MRLPWPQVVAPLAPGATGGGGGRVWAARTPGPARRERQGVRTAAPLRPEGEERHLLLHGRRGVARRYVRPQAETRRTGRPGVHGVEEPDGGRQPQVAEEPLEVSAAWRVGDAG